MVFFQSVYSPLDIIVYFGPISKFNAFAGFDRKKLEAEDLITINFVHNSKLISNLKATTRIIETTECLWIYYVEKVDF